MQQVEEVQNSMMQPADSSSLRLREEDEYGIDEEDEGQSISKACGSGNGVPLSNQASFADRPSKITSPRFPHVHQLSDTTQSNTNANIFQRPGTSQQELQKSRKCTPPGCDGRTSPDLSSHLLLHQNQYPEKCPVPNCEYHTKGFEQRSDMVHHALTHYHDSMGCPYCDDGNPESANTFNGAKELKRHLEAYHRAGFTGAGARALQDYQMQMSLLNGHNRKRLWRQRREAGHLSTEPEVLGKCPICKITLDTPRCLYKHFDDCVINALTAAFGKDARVGIATIVDSPALSGGIKRALV
jgi:hypothetical protein